MTKATFLRGGRWGGPWVHLVAIAVVLTLGGAASADEHERPSEVPYDTPAEIPALSPDYKMSSHKVVLITNQSLSPRLVTIESGQLVAWVSYSAAASTIVFEREVARSMICHSLVNFTIQDDELRSAPIHAGEFASFCELKPGRYRYKVTRAISDGSMGGSAPRRMLEGEIIVGDGEK